jgi:hypothetical protein
VTAPGASCCPGEACYWSWRWCWCCVCRAATHAVPCVALPSALLVCSHCVPTPVPHPNTGGASVAVVYVVVLPPMLRDPLHCWCAPIVRQPLFTFRKPPRQRQSTPLILPSDNAAAVRAKLMTLPTIPNVGRTNNADRGTRLPPPPPVQPWEFVLLLAPPPPWRKHASNY